MISISKLCCELNTDGDFIRYGAANSSDSKSDNSQNSGQTGHFIKSASDRRPVVVWNVTRTCNLSCVHCYTDSQNKLYSGELTFEEGIRFLDDLSNFKVPAVLLSGGEPLMRGDLFDLISYAKFKGLRITLSTNGTLINEASAIKLKEAGVRYVGISLDGLGEIHDKFRGKKGAFDLAVKGFRNCVRIGQKVGLRMTLTRHNYNNLNQIFDLIESEKIDRVCFYHLVYSGRGARIHKDDLTHEETRDAVETIIERTLRLHQQGVKLDCLTVDNPVDGVYLYLKYLQSDEKRAQYIYNLLKWNGGGLYGSGIGIGCVDFQGNVHPDQFWMHYSLGNVRERRFSDIWMSDKDIILTGLRNRRNMIKGRCASCRWFDLCGGALRVRADLVYGDPWMPDPACYLLDEEIS